MLDRSSEEVIGNLKVGMWTNSAVLKEQRLEGSNDLNESKLGRFVWRLRLGVESRAIHQLEGSLGTHDE